MSNPQTLTLAQPLPLECGGQLDGVQIAYHTYGTLNEAGDNAIWVCHALTANSDVLSWWSGLFSPGAYFNPADWFIVCANVLGSCYGSTGPTTPVAPRNKPLYAAFPRLTVRDLVAAHEQLRQHLCLTKIHTVIGGSLGGQQAVEWAIQQPEVFDHLVLLATNAQHSPWGIAFNEAQRLAIQADCTYAGGGPEGGKLGLRAARAMALLSYRSYEAYGRTQAEPNGDELPAFYQASSYQQYQGDKLTARFDAYSYVTLSHIMDSHHVGRGRGGVAAALARVRARTLVLGISSDVLFPPAEQQLLARHISGAMYAEMESGYGHDGFLIETAQIAHFLERFYVQTFAH
ncbi:homoserine O-acetyltransferase family protein [Hymenobacter sp. CRA2]|uniref:homoserine O-acetyltransferase family protein n=1 Tax=Hymenobacter sp. CRA2 TaxID=1955620 RepID=UPI00098F9911|nr:homoserine O-acetyltransferase [Hymenobacter sp. CRA2]OON66712.1 homoserine O-acetyltransferase [Hymenobacter sp. CRA2]